MDEPREEKINPYYKAWLAITGGGDNADFMNWIMSKHREFRESIGKGLMPMSEIYQSRFGSWIESQSFTLESV